MRIGRADPGSRIGSIGILRERTGRDPRQPPRAQPILDFGEANLAIISQDLKLGGSKYVKNIAFLDIRRQSCEKPACF